MQCTMQSILAITRMLAAHPDPVIDLHKQIALCHYMLMHGSALWAIMCRASHPGSFDDCV